MDKVAKYRKVIEKYLSKRASLKLTSSPGVEGRLIVDREKDEFVLLWIGWAGASYKHSLMFHLQILNGKVWIHQNRTDIDLAKILNEEGIPEKDIVLGFLAPYERENSGVIFAN